MESIIERDAFRIEEAAKRVPCSRGFLGKEIAAGKLPVVRLSRKCVRVRREDLEHYLQERVARGPRSNFAYVS